MPDSFPVLVIGAGPTGLTTATNCANAGNLVTVLEKDSFSVGGLARSAYRGNCHFDVAGQRYLDRFPDMLSWGADPVRIKRLSRILYRGKFLDHPLDPSEALLKSGLFGGILSLFSLFRSRLTPGASPIRQRFGSRLARLFHESHREKIWGHFPPETGRRSSAPWLDDFLYSPGPDQSGADYFDYPSLGSGAAWEKMRDNLVAGGHSVITGAEVVRIHHDEEAVQSVTAKDASGEEWVFYARAFVATLPLQDCILALFPEPGPETLAAARRLPYRNLITVILQVNRDALFPDTWLYVPDSRVYLSRIQNFRNWSRAMTPDTSTTWLALEYFCSGEDQLWTLDETELVELGKKELETLKLCRASEVLDGCVVRIEKACTLYGESSGEDLNLLKAALGRFSNLQFPGLDRIGS